MLKVKSILNYIWHRNGDELNREALFDGLGRQIKKLRISITDRCNFRCIYCMPEEGIPWISRKEILTFEEIGRVVKIFNQLGVKRLRLTGGEPLLRKDVEELVGRLSGIKGLNTISITTNGYFLAEKVEVLKKAGLSGINVSLDTLDRTRFVSIAKRDGFDKVIEGIKAAKKVGFSPIKINTVVIRGYNDDEIENFVRLAREENHQVRFIEFMPLDGTGIWRKELVVTAKEILDRVQKVAKIEPIQQDSSAPARIYRFQEGPGEIGIIASISQPFCQSCDRIRLTADGKILNCLFTLEGYDLKPLLRGRARDIEIKNLIISAVKAKWAGHLINYREFIKPKQPMHVIGG